MRGSFLSKTPISEKRADHWGGELRRAFFLFSYASATSIDIQETAFRLCSMPQIAFFDSIAELSKRIAELSKRFYLRKKSKHFKPFPKSPLFLVMQPDETFANITQRKGCSALIWQNRRLVLGPYTQTKIDQPKKVLNFSFDLEIEEFTWYVMIIVGFTLFNISSRQVLTLFVVSIPSVKTTIVPPDASPFPSSICKHYLLD